MLLFALLFVLLHVLYGCDRQGGAPRPDVSQTEIVLDSLFTLDFNDSPSAPEFTAQLARRSDGQGFVVAPASRPAELLVLDQHGVHARTVSRRGAGPGELSLVQALAFDGGDTLWVFGPNRIDLWDPGYTHVRSIPLAFTVRAATAMGAGMLVSGLSPDPADMAYRVRMIDRNGSVSMLGRESRPIVQGDPGSEFRPLARVDDETFWVASFHEYDLRLLHVSGDTVLQVSDPPDWWRPAGASAGMEDMMDLSPAILDIGVDCDEQLWVAAGIPLPAPDAMERVAGGDVAALRELADHVVRVHRSDGQLVAERRFDYLPLRFLSRTLAYSVDPDDRYGVRVTVWRYGTTSPQRSPARSSFRDGNDAACYGDSTFTTISMMVRRRSRSQR